MFLFKDEGRETITLLGSLERANPNHQIQFPKGCVFLVFRIPDDERNPETQ
jgi:hypothetical protein